MTTTNFLDKTGLEYYTNKLDERFLSSSSAAKRIVELSEIVSTDTDGTEYIDPRYLLADNYYVADKNYTARLIKTSGVVNESFNGSGSTPSISTYDTFNIYEGDKLIGNASRNYSVFNAGTAFRVTSATRDLLLNSTSTRQNLNSESGTTSGFIGLNLTTYSYTWTTKDLLADGITSYNDLTDKLVAGDNINISDDNVISATNTLIPITEKTNLAVLSSGTYIVDVEGYKGAYLYIPISADFVFENVDTKDLVEDSYIRVSGGIVNVVNRTLSSGKISILVTLIPEYNCASTIRWNDDDEDYQYAEVKTRYNTPLIMSGADYCSNIIEFMKKGEDLGPQEAKINYVSTKSTPPATFSGNINVTTADTTWQPLSLDDISKPGDFIIPKDSILLGQGANAISSQPMIAHFSDGRIYEIWCTSANLGMITTLYTPSSGGSDVAISTTEPTGDEVVWINPDEEFTSTMASEVVDSLSGDQHNMAPSVAAIKNLHTYSTNEQVIGTWIDGKKIYRKVIAIGSVSGGSAITTDTGLDLNNVSILSLNAIYTTTANNIMGTNFANPLAPNAMIGTRLNSAGKIFTIAGTENPISNGYATIEYIKTAD